jgi:hypothetical protein
LTSAARASSLNGKGSKIGTLYLRKPLANHSAIERISFIGGVLPWLAVLAVTLSELYVRITFGRWPRMYLDSPDFPLTGAAALVVMFADLGRPGMIPVALLLPMVRLGLRARPVFNRWTVLCLTGTSVLYLFLKIDPYGFLDWAYD